MLLRTLGVSLLGDMLFAKKAKGTIRAGYGSKWTLLKKKLFFRIL